MFNHLRTKRHLGAEEFMNLVDGLDVREDRASHISNCSDCQSTLASITELHQTLSDSESEDVESANFENDPNGNVDAALANVDWARLRSSVRDRLLAGAVKRESVLQRWTGWTLRPAAAWSIAVFILLTAMTAGGLWHHQTAHPTDSITGIPSIDGVSLSSVDSDPGFVLFADDSEVEDAESLAWAQMEIFAVLNELESGEEDMLRELISLASAESSVLDEAVQ